MPFIIIKVPEGVFEGAARHKLVAGVTAAAKDAEQIGDDPRQEFLTFVQIEEIKAGCLFAGGHDVSAQVAPVIVLWHAPQGVFDDAGRVRAITLVHEAIAAAVPASETRRLVTSVMVGDVPDGSWSANGVRWRLADFARAAGFKHLQHLVPSLAQV